ncbi:hypothetical protein ZWY2020_019046 [Hordeum vulgare]|nr:hypothetical protein ZWY2020_019046 [Hordeum vulgare]
MPPPQTSAADIASAGGGRSRARRIAHRTRDTCVSVLCSRLCSVLLAVILVAGVALFVASLSLRPHRPRFALASFSLSGSVPGGKAEFNVSECNPNRDIGIYYDGDTRASLRFYDALVASGPAFPAGWYQPNMTTVSVAGVLDVVGPTHGDPAAWHSFSAALQVGRLPLPAGAHLHGRPLQSHHNLPVAVAVERWQAEDACQVLCGRRRRRQAAPRLRGSAMRQILVNEFSSPITCLLVIQLIA